MKKSSIKDLRTKTQKELKTLLLSIEKELIDAKMALETKKQKNTRISKFNRIEKARIKSIIREKELEEKNG